ncbi:MAG TPA: tRNA lysidine(34) synthetase TilS [Bacteroidia bacterium]
MIESFKKNIAKKILFAKTDKLLLGVSGGKDSMALAHLLINSGYNFVVAHCNFQLRGEEADKDEQFVREFFEVKGLKVLTMKFQTKQYAEQNKCSIQMAARELRYNWFNELKENETCNFIVTAHHANDNIETFFINLLRGSGLNGLKGIPEKTTEVVRPLLYATREEIDEYIKQEHIPFREDSSNTEEKYLRNKIRKQIIPVLKEINPSLEQTMNAEMQILKQSHDLLSEVIAENLANFVIESEHETRIELKDIILLSYRNLLIYEAIRKFGFAMESIEQISGSIDNKQPGKQFYSSSHCLVIDRGFLIVRPLETGTQPNQFELNEEVKELAFPLHLKLTKQDGRHINKSENTASLDLDKLHFPLILTKWREGDAFYPFGMKGSKKLSDFFVGQKMSMFDKQEQWILRSGSDIVWVVGRRTDERYKVDENTKTTLLIEWNK